MNKVPKTPYRDLINEIGKQRDGKAWLFVMTMLIGLFILSILGGIAIIVEGTSC